MIFTPEIKAAFEVLRNAAQNDFERHRIDVLEKDLISPPQVETIDETHQKFNGNSFSITPKGHFRENYFLHRAVYEYYFGEIPENCVIHHIDKDKYNNDISNLQLLTIEEHADIHSHDRISARNMHVYTCRQCGKKYKAYETGNNRFCSLTCRKKYRQTSPEKLSERECVICGKIFKSRKDKPTRTCSAVCAGKLARITAKKSPKKMEDKICAECGKVFQADTHYPKTKFCSDKCKRIYNHRNDKEKRTCIICGKEFFTRKYRTAQTCSRLCAGKLSSLNRQANKD